MIAEGEKLAALHLQIVVKIPMIKEEIKAIKYFSDKGKEPIAFWSFRQDKRFWLQKLERLMFRLSSED